MKINIHYSFLVLAVICLFTSKIIEMFIFLFIILLHELSHALVGLAFHKKVKRITITMIGGVVEICGNYSTFLKEFLINVSGIIMNCIILALASFLKNDYYKNLIVDFNCLMIIINVLPIYPLDGYRLLDSLVYSYFHSFKAMKKVVLISIVSSFLFLLFGIFEKSGGIIIIGIFLIFKNLGLKFHQETLFVRKEVSYYQNNLLTN